MAVSKEALYFRGVSVGEQVEHIWDHNQRGVVTKIEIPLIYVQFGTEKKSRIMDRDEIVSQEQLRDKARKAQRVQREREKAQQMRRQNDDVPEFEPELPPGME